MRGLVLAVQEFVAVVVAAGCSYEGYCDAGQEKCYPVTKRKRLLFYCSFLVPLEFDNGDENSLKSSNQIDQVCSKLCR